MKKFMISLSIALLAISCKEDETAPIQEPAVLSDLALYLNGEFDLNKVHYQGTVNSVLGSQELDAFGENTKGYYAMYSELGQISYLVETFIEIELFGDKYDLPLLVEDSTSVSFDSDSSFVVNDKDVGLMRYRLGQSWPDSCRLFLRYQDDTAGFNLDLNLEMYLYRR